MGDSDVVGWVMWWVGDADVDDGVMGRVRGGADVAVALITLTLP